MKLPTNVRVVWLWVVLGLVTPALALAQVQPVEQEQLLPSKKKEADKLGTAFTIARFVNAGGSALDLSSTVRALNHPVVAKRPDGTVLSYYYPAEAGWMKCFGKRNTFAVSAGNAALDFGTDYLSRRLFAKGGKWRYLALGLSTFKGVQNTRAGIHNFMHNANVNNEVRLTTGYHGPIVWSSHP